MLKENYDFMMPNANLFRLGLVETASEITRHVVTTNGKII